MWDDFQIIAYDHGPSLENVDFINSLTSCFDSAGKIFPDFQFQYAIKFTDLFESSRDQT